MYQSVNCQINVQVYLASRGTVAYSFPERIEFTLLFGKTLLQVWIKGL